MCLLRIIVIRLCNLTNMKYLVSILVLSTMLFCVSCKRCTRYTKGYVVDRETKKPIVGATIVSYAALNDRARDRRYTYADTNGWFETAFILDRVAKCGNLKLLVSHPDYHSGYAVDMPENDTVFLERKKK